MPLHIFLSQSLSLVTGGLEAWKIGKDVLLLLLVLFTICLVFWKKKAGKPFKLLLAAAVLYGFLHLLLWLAHPGLHTESAILGSIYNVRLFGFAVLSYGAVLLMPKFAFSSVLKVVLGISTVVAFLGVLQYFLPNDLLTHVGYSLERGVRPAFAIDDNASFPRIMATLREPNALGAYLMLPIAAMVALLFRLRDANKRLIIGGALGLHLLAVLLTFSRSAWLATAVVALLVVWWQKRTWVLNYARRFWPMVALIIVLVGIIGYSQRHSHLFQQYIVHSNPSEQVQDLDSNDYHSLLVTEGLKGVQEAPLGHGPGTAGIVSIRNPNGGQLTENYYIQIAYEVGILGASLFIAVNIWFCVKLWQRRDLYSVILCASFLGYVLTNMLLHTWSNEAVAAQWWILAGMALAAGSKTVRSSKQNT